MNKPYYRILTAKDADSPKRDSTSIFEPYLSRLQVYDNTAGKSDAIKLELVDDGSIQFPEPGFIVDCEIGFDGGFARRFDSFVVDQVYADGPPDRLQFSATGADFSKGARSPKERTHSGKPEDPLTLRKLLTRLAV